MSHGTKKASVDGAFSARIIELETTALQLADQFQTLDNFRPWVVPQALKTRDLLDVPSLHEPAWNRNKLNEMYSEQVLSGPGSSGGTVADLIGIKWQVDFMATEERAFRFRHASYARCASLMHGRLDGHGQNPDSVFSYFLASVEEVIQAGESHGAPDDRDVALAARTA